ncbi:MAG: hypothetical protein ACLS6O_08445 [Bifidobacterium sp.]
MLNRSISAWCFAEWQQKLVHVEGAENAVDRDDVFINADHETIKTAVKNWWRTPSTILRNTPQSR